MIFVNCTLPATDAGNVAKETVSGASPVTRLKASVDPRKMKQIASKEAWTGIADCRNCGLRRSALFAELTEDDFKRLHSPVDQYDYPEGTTIYRSGQSLGTMFTIRSGLVKLVQYLPDGSQRIVRLLRSGDIAGLECIVDDCCHHDAIALHPTQACRLSVDEVKKIAHDNPKLFNELMSRWNRALSDADFWLTGLSTGSARQRMARLLMRLVGDNPDGYCRFFGREDVGGILGITTETASRVIAEFKRKGLITQASQNRFQCDLARLGVIVDGTAGAGD